MSLYNRCETGDILWPIVPHEKVVIYIWWEQVSDKEKKMQDLALQILVEDLLKAQDWVEL